MRIATLAAVSGVALASTAFAGFSFSSSREVGVDGEPLDKISVFTLNDGNGTGFGLIALDVGFRSTGGSMIFRSSTTGAPDVLNNADIDYRSSIRVDPADPSSSSIVQRTPTGNWPFRSDLGSRTVGINDFGIVLASLAGSVPAQDARGNLFATLFVDTGAQAFLKANSKVGGSAGGATVTDVDIEIGGGGTPIDNPPAFGADVYNLVLDLGTSGSANGSVAASATDPDAGQNPVITNGALPAFVTAAGDNPRDFTGALDSLEAMAAGWDRVNPLVIDVPLTATSNGLTDSATLRISIIPEPATLGLLAGAGLLALRRRA
jgi:hypothetical protein